VIGFPVLYLRDGDLRRVFGLKVREEKRGGRIIIIPLFVIW
jgi:hypothetical protein